MSSKSRISIISLDKISLKKFTSIGHSLSKTEDTNNYSPTTSISSKRTLSNSSLWSPNSSNSSMTTLMPTPTSQSKKKPRRSHQTSLTSSQSFTKKSSICPHWIQQQAPLQSITPLAVMPQTSARSSAIHSKRKPSLMTSSISTKADGSQNKSSNTISSSKQVNYERLFYMEDRPGSSFSTMDSILDEDDKIEQDDEDYGDGDNDINEVSNKEINNIIKHNNEPPINNENQLIVTNQPRPSSYNRYNQDENEQEHLEKLQLQQHQQSSAISPRTSLQSADLSMEYHKLENTVNTASSIMANGGGSLGGALRVAGSGGRRKKPPISNAWNDEHENHFNHRNINRIATANNNGAGLMVIQQGIHKKDQMTILCFCASALSTIATLAIYCTQ